MVEDYKANIVFDDYLQGLPPNIYQQAEEYLKEHGFSKIGKGTKDDPYRWVRIGK